MDHKSRPAIAGIIRPSYFSSVPVLMLLLLLLATAGAYAQTVTFGGAQSAISSFPAGSLSPIAVDAAGDIFAVSNDGTTNSLIKVSAAGGQTVLYSNFPFSPYAIAVNPAGNTLYFIHSGAPWAMPAGGTNTVYVAKTTISGGVTFPPTELPRTFNPGWPTSYIDPHDLKVDSAGNVYIADFGGGLLWKIPSGFSVPTQFLMPTVGQPYDIALSPDGYVYFTYVDYTNSSKNTLSRIAASAFGTSFSGVAPTVVNSSLTSIQSGLVIDSSGNILVGGSDGVVYKVSGGTLTAVTPSSPNGLTSFGVDSTGKIFTSGGDGAGGSAISTTSFTSAGFGSQSIGSATAALPLKFSFVTGGKLGSINVLTQGASGLDFSNAGSGTCNTTTTYAAGNICTVDVTFTPAYAGLRQGAVVLKNTSGVILSTVFVYGSGLGPQIAFSPAVQSVIGSGLSGAGYLAVDGAGNVYVSDIFHNRVLKETLSGGSYSESVVADSSTNGLNRPMGVAVDGAGNVYIADNTNNRVLKETPSGGSYAQSVVADSSANGLGNPADVAVDGAGNVYIADSFNNRVLKETLSGGGYTQSVVADSSTNGLNVPVGVAVDGAGNVYIADNANNRVLKETLSGGSYAQSVVADSSTNGPVMPMGVAVDVLGNVYIGDYGYGRILKETPSGGSYTQSVVADATNGLSYPYGVAVQGNGNVYFADYGNGLVLKEDFAHAPALSFATTRVGTPSSDSPKTVTVTNIGNLALDIWVPATDYNPTLGANFYLGNSSTCQQLSASSTDDFLLAAGASCTYEIGFNPTTSGSHSESLVMTDNAIPGTQTIALSGTGLPPVNVSLSVTPSNSTVNQSVTIKVTVSGGSGTPTGLVDITSNGTPATVCSGLVLDGTGSASCVTSALRTNVTNVTATYGGDMTYAVSSGSANVTVAPLTPSVTLTASPASPQRVNTSVTFTASLTGVPLTPTQPSGTFTFAANGTTISGCSAQIVTSTGIATCTVSSLPAGAKNITATFTPSDSNYVAAAPGSTNYTVTALTPTVTVTASPVSPSPVNTSVTFTAKLTGVPLTPVQPSGAFGFFDSVTSAAIPGCSAAPVSSGGVATCTTSSLSANFRTITATYSGDTNYVAAGPGNITYAVVAPPSITEAFGLTQIPQNGSTSLTFTIQNPNTTVVLTGAFTDNLPAGLVVATPNNLNNTCGGTATAVAGAGSVSLSGGTLFTNASCTVSVSVQGTTPGVKNNSVQVTSIEGGTGNTSNASIGVVAPPVIIKAFGAASIPLNGSISLTFTINNPNASYALNGLNFSDTLPAGLIISTPNGLSGSCGAGTITATAGTNVIGLSGGATNPAGSCTFSVNITGTSAGTKNNTTGAVTSIEGGTGVTASASINVVAPPSIAKAFNPTHVSLNGSSTLTFTITNPAANAVGETGVAFTDTLPAGVIVATPNGLTNTCGGTATAVAGAGSMSLTGGTIATSSNCTLTVNVTGTVSGNFVNTTGAVTSTNGGTGNTATAILTVASPPTITKMFGLSHMPLNWTTWMSFTIQNPNTGVALTGLAFTDNLPAGLVIASPNNLTNTCGGTATAVAGSGSVILSGGTLAASASCTVSVSIIGTTPGVKNNSVQVTSIEGGTGNTSNASITVVGPPVIIKAFGAASIPLNGSTSLTFTIQNNNTTTTLTGIDFSDTLPAGLRPMVDGAVAPCGGAVVMSNMITNVISLNSATLAPNTSCTFSLNVKGLSAGTQNNTTSAISSNEGGMGGTASASVTVEAPPVLQKCFGVACAGAVPQLVSWWSAGGNASDLVGSNNGTLQAGASYAAGKVGQAFSFTGALDSFVDVLNSPSLNPAGAFTIRGWFFIDPALQGARPNVMLASKSDGSSNGGWFLEYTTATNGWANALRFTVAGSGSHADAVLNNAVNAAQWYYVAGVYDPADATPVKLYLNGTLVASATGPIAMDSNSFSFRIGASHWSDVYGLGSDRLNGLADEVQFFNSAVPASEITAGYSAGISLNATTPLTFTILNPAANALAEQGVAFTDTLPAGMVVATPNALTNTCGGTATAVAGAGSLSLTGGTIATSSNCTLTVNVTGTASGVLVNTTGSVTSTNGGTGNTATAILTVASPPTITKAFGLASIPLGGTTSLTFNVTNPNNGLALTGVGFTDNLPAGLTVAATPNLASTCGGTTTAVAGSGAVSLSGGTLAISASCTVSVNVTGTTAGVKNNTVTVTSIEGGTGDTSNASITVVAPPVIIKAFGAASIQLNAGTTLTFTIQNNNVTTTLTGVSFSDTFPSGLAIASPNGLTGSCGSGTITATAGAGVVSLTGGTLAASGSCMFAVNVTGIAGGTQNNTTGNVTSTEGGTGGTASASITVLAPDLTIASTHNGNFRQGQTGASYSMTVTNSGAAPTSGTVTVVDVVPSVLTPTAMSGTGWTCAVANLTCTRSDTLPIAGSYPPISLTVNVANNAPATVTNTAVVAGGSETDTANDTATDPTIVTPVADLTVFNSHTSTLIQGLTGTFTIAVNNVGPGPTVGTVTLTDTLPTGLTATAISGSGWTCTLATLNCTRSDVLANGSSYPAITLTVNVAGNAPATLTNTATVSGGGELNTANDAGTDVSTIQSALTLTSTVSSRTVFAGDTGQFILGVATATGITGQVTFACSSMPVGANCNFSPSSVSASTTQQNITLMVTTAPKYLASKAPQQPSSRKSVFYAMLMFPAMGMVLLGFAGRSRRSSALRIITLLLISAGMIALSSCGGGRTQNVGATPPGTYTITVTATTGTSQAQTPVTLTVQ